MFSLDPNLRPNDQRSFGSRISAFVPGWATKAAAIAVLCGIIGCDNAKTNSTGIEKNQGPLPVNPKNQDQTGQEETLPNPFGELAPKEKEETTDELPNPFGEFTAEPAQEGDLPNPFGELTQNESSPQELKGEKQQVKDGDQTELPNPFGEFQPPVEKEQIVQEQSGDLPNPFGEFKTPDPVDPKPKRTATTPSRYEWPGVQEVWATHISNKIPVETTPASALPRNQRGQLNSPIYTGKKIDLIALRNETVSFSVIVEAPKGWAKDVTVAFDTLTGPNGAKITADKIEKPSDLFHYPDNDIEVFAVEGLRIEGMSILGYAGEYYDVRHAPLGYRLKAREGDRHARPLKTTRWEDRPFHDMQIPDICYPIETSDPINIAPGTNQTFVADIFIGKDVAPGTYKGTFSVYEDRAGGHDKPIRSIPVELRVGDGEISDEHSFNIYAFTGHGLQARHGFGYNAAGDKADDAEELANLQYQMLHRHRVGGIEDNYFADLRGLEHPTPEQEKRINGKLYTEKHGYDGPGIGVGERQFMPFIYGGNPVYNHSVTPEEIAEYIEGHLEWLRKKGYDTRLLVPMIDEPDKDDRETIARIREVARALQELKKREPNGSQLSTLVTMSLVDGLEKLPEVDILSSAAMDTGEDSKWIRALTKARQDGRIIEFYNSARPRTGTLMTEGNGIDPMTLPVIGVRYGADQWFLWDTTHYGERPDINVFTTAQTFGTFSQRDPVKGKTGDRYSNGDGVLIYPGKDVNFPDSSPDLPGPIASLRLKNLRNGVQIATLITQASLINERKTIQIVEQLIPEALWDSRSIPGDQKGPNWIHREMGWNQNPNDWELAARELKKIIVRGK